MLPRKLMFAALAIAAASAAIASSAYEDEIAEYRKARDARLRSDSYYLAITGLFWLSEGDNTFGGGEDNDLVFSGREVAKRMGTIHLSEGKLSVTIDEGVDVKVDGEVVGKMTIYDDADEENARTVFEMGTMSWYVIKRGPKYGVRLRDTESEILKSFKGVECYEVDPSWRIEARFEAYNPIRKIPIANVIDVTEDEDCPGAVVFEREGKTFRIDAIAEQGEKLLFIIFADETSGLETYGAGRFIYIERPDADGKIVIDFNKAYNPPCAFSPFSTCPLPPEQNLLPIKVTAGEKTYATDQGYSAHP